MWAVDNFYFLEGRDQWWHKRHSILADKFHIFMKFLISIKITTWKMTRRTRGRKNHENVLESKLGSGSNPPGFDVIFINENIGMLLFSKVFSVKATDNLQNIIEDKILCETIVIVLENNSYCFGK